MFLDLSGYHLTYDQEFSKSAPFTVSPDGMGAMFKTQFDWGGRYNPSNNEWEFYSDPAFGVNPFSLENGALVITAAPAAGGAGPNTWGRPYTSGMITTEKTFSQHGGYFEMRAKVPGQQGLWGAFWMIPTTLQDYPEIDVLEDPNLGSKGQYFLHSTAPEDSDGGFVQTPAALYKGYHQYGVEWNDQTITFYFDHKAIVEYPTPPEFGPLNMYLVLNLAVGGPGSWPGAAPATSFPAQYKIDYIRVFSNKPSDPAVSQHLLSSPDAVDTLPSYAPALVPVVTTGTGPHALALSVAEDFFSRDAKFTVSIDGVQQGGIFSTIAVNAKGQTQSFVFNGAYASGPHTMTVAFINAYAGGAPYLNRNFYLTGATLDGAGIAGVPRGNMAGGTHTLNFAIP